MKRVAISVSCMFGIFLLALTLILVLASPPDWALEHFPKLYYEHSDWISVWLSILAVIVSLYTAIIANFISNFSFNASIAMPIKSKEWIVNPVPNMNEIDLIWNDLNSHINITNVSNLKYYRIEVDLARTEMPLLNYILEEISFEILDDKEIDFKDNIYAEFLSQGETQKMILHILSANEEDLKVLTFFSEPYLFPFEKYADAFVRMKFKVKATSGPYENYMLVNLGLKKDESSIYKIHKNETSFESKDLTYYWNFVHSFLVQKFDIKVKK